MSIDLKFSTIVTLFRWLILFNTTLTFLILWSDARNNAVISHSQHNSRVYSVMAHFSDVIMSPVAPKISGVYWCSASLGFVREINPWPVNSPHKRPITRNMFPFDVAILDAGDCIMDSPTDDIPRLWCNFGYQERIFIFVFISYRVIKWTVTQFIQAFCISTL